MDYQRFKAEGAIAVIEQKVKEAGGKTRPDTIEERAERLKRLRIAEKEREAFLQSHEAVQAVNQELLNIIDKLKKLKPLIEDTSTNLNLVSFERQNPPMYEFGFRGYFLCFNNSTPFDFDINNVKLRVSLYEKKGHQHIDYKENIHKQEILKFDRDLIGNNGWSNYKTGNNFRTTNELIDKWVKNFIDEIGKIRKNHS